MQIGINYSLIHSFYLLLIGFYILDLLDSMIIKFNIGVLIIYTNI